MARATKNSDHGTYSTRPWESELGIIFSLRDGYVWASWQDSEASVRLGRHEMVAAMMRDFLAQDAIGLRLSGHRPGDAH